MRNGGNNIPIGVTIHGSTNPSRIAALTQQIEALSFESVWLAEDYFFTGGFSAAGIALQASSNLKVGLGVVASVVRHPALTAMEISTLAGAFPGRFLPAIGHGVPFWTCQMGLYPKSILQTLRECIESVRALLKGETLTQHEGHFYFDQIALCHQIADLDIYAGVTGPKSLSLAGEIADGTIISVLAAPEYIEVAQTHINKGIAKSERKGPHKLPTYALYAVTEDREVARNAVRKTLAFYLAAAGPTAITEPLGINDQIAELAEAGGAELIEKEMPESWLDKLAVAGSPEECAERISGLFKAGATSVVLSPIMLHDIERQLDITAAYVKPLVEGPF